MGTVPETNPAESTQGPFLKTFKSDSGGYTSQLILLSPSAGTSTPGTLLFSQVDR
jgi:hypothetical protein